MTSITRLYRAFAVTALLLASNEVQATSYAYILNDSSTTVSVIDTATNQIIAQPDIGGTSIHGSAVLPNGNFAYLGVYGANRVAVVDTADQAVVATVTGIDRPRALAALPDSNRVYVGSQGSPSVSVIDTATNTITAQIALAAGTTAVSFAASPDGSRVYFVQGTSELVRVIDTTTNTLTGQQVSGGTSPLGLAVSPDGSTLYVAANGNGLVRVIDTATMTLSRTITAGANPTGVAVSPDGATLFVGTASGSVLRVIDAATGTGIANITTGSQPVGVALNAAGTRAYVTNFGSNTVSIVDTGSNTVIATVNAPQPTGIGKFVTPELSLLTVGGNGARIVAGSGSGPQLACTGSCRRNFATTATVTLTATAVDPNTVFDSWGGDCSGRTASTTITMTAARNCIANIRSVPTPPAVPPAWFNPDVLPQHLVTMVGNDGQFRTASLAPGFKSPATLSITAASADGSPLPAGIGFDPTSLTFNGTVPMTGQPIQRGGDGANLIYPPSPQINSLPVMVTARDAVGNSYSLIQYLDLNMPRPPAAMAALSISRVNAGNALSTRPALSRDGGQIVFERAATNLVTTAAPSGTDILRYRALSGDLDRLSQSAFPAGGPTGGALGPAIDPAISDDGRYAAFAGSGQGLVLGLNTNGVRQIYRVGLKYPRIDRDPGTPVAELVSGTDAGIAGNGHSDGAALSADGRFVAFSSTATNLAGGFDGIRRIWRRDMTTGTLTLVSATETGQPMTSPSSDPAITADGRFVAFASGSRIHLKDLQTNAVWNVAEGRRPRLSANGEAIVFASAGSVVIARGGTMDIIGAGDQPSISGDARFVAWRTPAGQIQVADVMRGTSSLVSKTANGKAGNGLSGSPAISGDGRSIVFTTEATDLLDTGIAPGQVILAANPLINPAGTRYWQTTTDDRQSFAIERRGARAYVASLTYDATGKPTWIAGFCSFSDLTCTGSGFSIVFAGNGVDATLTTGQATMALRARPLAGTTLPAMPGLPEAGWWYNTDDPAGATGWFLATATPGENGIPEATRALLVGALYDGAGRAFWTAAQGTIDGSTSFSFGATLEMFAGGAPLGQAAIQAPSATPLGPVTISWTGPRTAVAAMPDGRRINLARWAF